MPTPTNAQEAFDRAVVNPAQAQFGNQSAQSHPLADLQEAAEREKANEAATRPGFGIRTQKVKMRYR